MVFWTLHTRHTSYCPTLAQKIEMTISMWISLFSVQIVLFLIATSISCDVGLDHGQKKWWLIAEALTRHKAIRLRESTNASTIAAFTNLPSQRFK